MKFHEIKVFIGTYDVPAGGKFYNLSVDEEKEAALKKWEALCNGTREPLISAIETDFNLIEENTLQYYIDMQEGLYSTDGDDHIVYEMMLEHDNRYYNTFDLLKSGKENTNLHHGDIEDLAEDVYRDKLLNACIAEDLVDDIMMYFNAENYTSNLNTSGTIVEATIDGQDYCLEIY